MPGGRRLQLALWVLLAWWELSRGSLCVYFLVASAIVLAWLAKDGWMEERAEPGLIGTIKKFSLSERQRDAEAPPAGTVAEAVASPLISLARMRSVTLSTILSEMRSDLSLVSIVLLTSSRLQELFSSSDVSSIATER